MKRIFLFSFILTLASLSEQNRETLFISKRKGRVEDVQKLFRRFIIDYDKNYESMDQYLYRLRVFDSNLKKFDAHNSNEQSTHTMGINFFADMLPEDLKKHKHAIKQPNKIVTPIQGDGDLNMTKSNFDKKKNGDVNSKTIDWTQHNVVPPVKDEGILGSGTDQLITYCIDSANAIKSSTELSKYYAQQELMDCTQDLQSAIQFTVSKGLETVQDYKNSIPDQYPSDTSFTHSNSYNSNMRKSKRAGKCSYDPSKPALHVKEWDLIKSGSTAKTQMVNQLQKQPMVVLVNADSGDFMYYMGGILKDGCSQKDIQLNHSLLLVGYDEEQDTWKLQNTWGSSWGEHGYIRMSSGKNLCRVQSYPLVAVLYD